MPNSKPRDYSWKRVTFYLCHNQFLGEVQYTGVDLPLALALASTLASREEPQKK